MSLFTIHAWAQFETHETKKYKALAWVPTPNKHDGLGFRRMAKREDRCELFAAWNLLLQVASKGTQSERGILSRDGKALTSVDLEDMTGFPARIFELAFSFFSSPEIGWLVQSPGVAGDQPATTADYPGVTGCQQPERKKEQKEEREPTPPPEIPSETEVVAYGAGGVGIPADFCRDYHAKACEQNRWVTNGTVRGWRSEIKRWWEKDKESWMQKRKNGHAKPERSAYGPTLT